MSITTAHATFVANTTAQSLSNLSVTVPSWATQMLVFVETTNAVLRYKADGNSPNTTVGTPILASLSNPFIIEQSGAISGAKFVSANGATANVTVEFRKKLV